MKMPRPKKAEKKEEEKKKPVKKEEEEEEEDWDAMDYVEEIEAENQPEDDADFY